MIRAGASPQQRLAAAIHGTVLGPDAIQVGTHLVVTSVLGVVRVDGHKVGMCSDPTDVLAARVAAVVGEEVA